MSVLDKGGMSTSSSGSYSPNPGGKSPGTHWIGGWGGHRMCPNGLEKPNVFPALWYLNDNFSVVYPVAYDSDLATGISQPNRS
jgi:hypothetical protein